MRSSSKAIVFGLIFCLLNANAAFADSLSLIRDAETEALISDYASPIFRAAGPELAGRGIEVHIVNDTSFNAFVVDGHNMFINTGAILLSETPNMLIGVIAHETGHIKGKHLSSLRNQIAKLQTAALMMQLLSIGAMAGGAVTHNTDAAQAGGAGLYGSNQVIMGSILSYRRAQESSADQAGVEFLTRTHQSAEGMLRTFRFFLNQNMGLSSQINPYMLTHPMPQERLGQLEEIAKQSPYFNVKDSPQLQLRHDLVRAKIAAYTYKNNPQRILREYPGDSLPAKYARAIVTYYNGGYQVAAKQIDQLIAAMPQNPYFYELKGTFLLESGNAKDAVAPFRKAVALAPKSAYIRIELAQALLESDDGRNAEEALKLLRLALVDEDQSYLGYRLEAQALGKLNRGAEADLASALASFHSGDWKAAKMLAKRAQNGLPTGTPGWIKADDIINFKAPNLGG